MHERCFPQMFILQVVYVLDMGPGHPEQKESLADMYTALEPPAGKGMDAHSAERNGGGSGAAGGGGTGAAQLLRQLGYTVTQTEGRVYTALPAAAEPG